MENGQDSFKRNIKKIIELDSEENKLKEMLNKIKEEKDSINNNLVLFMETNNITGKDIIYGDRKIKYIKTKNIESITKKLIFEKLNQYFKSNKEATEITEFIYSYRKSDYKTSIKVSNIKNK